jgi:hypothetical protein
MFASKTRSRLSISACATHATFHTLNFPSSVSTRATDPGRTMVG